MINYEKVGEKLFSIIKGHNHNLVMFNEEGMETNDASEARRFFVNKPNYMITLDAENRKIKFNKNAHVTLEEIESVMKQIKNLATVNMLKNEVQVFGKEITPKDFAYQAKQFKESDMNDISEASLSRMSGYKKTSYQTLESVKMVVRHRKAVDEDVRGSRSRQISAIFLEQAGERFRFPYNNLAGGRAMARHMYEGGNMQDTIGEYIIETTGNVIKLTEFVRYARSNKLMNEANEDVVKTVKENINTLRAEIKGLTGAKSYATMSETISAREANVLEEDDTTDLQDMFTVRKFDEKITDTLPLIKRLMDNKQTWRDAILEASQVEIAISEKTELAEQDIFEFENPIQAMGYKVQGIADRMIGESDLSVFVGKVAGKLIEGADISSFEKTVVGNVLENARISEAEEKLCENCGKLHEDCGCSTKDVVSLISDSFASKMEMLENEEIFTEETVNEECDNCREWDPDDQNVCPECHGGRGFAESEEIDENYTSDTIVSHCCGVESDPDVGKCSNCYEDCSFETEAEHHSEMSDDDRSAAWQRNSSRPIREVEGGETCIRCRKGTMHRGDTMMGPAKQCDRCGYQLQVNEADNDDHHAGETKAGAHMGMPPEDAEGMHLDYEACPECEGSGLGLDDISDCYVCHGTGSAGEINANEFDGQPTDYEEMQDFMGGDDWDHGQFDESLNELRKAAGIEITEVADPAAANECPECKGDGNAKDSIFDDDDCSECNGTGEVE